MDTTARRYLKLIAISTTFLAVVVALGIALSLVGIFLSYSHGGGTAHIVTVQRAP